MGGKDTEQIIQQVTAKLLNPNSYSQDVLTLARHLRAWSLTKRQDTVPCSDIAGNIVTNIVAAEHYDGEASYWVSKETSAICHRLAYGFDSQTPEKLLFFAHTAEDTFVEVNAHVAQAKIVATVQDYASMEIQFIANKVVFHQGERPF